MNVSLYVLENKIYEILKEYRGVGDVYSGCVGILTNRETWLFDKLSAETGFPNDVEVRHFFYEAIKEYRDNKKSSLHSVSSGILSAKETWFMDYLLSKNGILVKKTKDSQNEQENIFKI